MQEESPLGARASCPHSSASPKGWYSRGYLPHLDAPDLIQAITFRLADSLPAGVAERLKDDPDRRRPDRRRKVEALLDQNMGSALLGDGFAAELVQDALLHFDGQRYRLLAWVIMPNHVHCIIETLPEWPIHNIVQSWKSFTSVQINRLAERQGRLWQPDYFDRYIRDDHHPAAQGNRVNGHSCPLPLRERAASIRERVRGARVGAAHDRFHHVKTAKVDSSPARPLTQPSPARGEGSLSVHPIALSGRRDRLYIAYIESNLVKAGLAAQPEDWLWGNACMRARRPRSQDSILLQESVTP